MALFPADTTDFGDASQRAMLNYRVDDLDALLAQLQAEGVTVLPERHQDEHGRLAWIVDPEGNASSPGSLPKDTEPSGS